MVNIQYPHEQGKDNNSNTGDTTASEGEEESTSEGGF
jgi:hypothetical protein